MKKLLFGQIYKIDKYDLIVCCGENKKPIKLLFTESDISKARGRAEKNIEDLPDADFKHIECEQLEEKLKTKDNHMLVLMDEIAISHRKLNKSLEYCHNLEEKLKDISYRVKFAKHCSCICFVLGILITICGYFVFIG